MEDVLYQAGADPAAVLLKEPLPDSQGAFKLLRTEPDVCDVILSDVVFVFQMSSALPS